MTAQEIAVARMRRHFSAHAGEYDRYAVVQKRVVRRLLELLTQAEPFADPVVDLGTGTGDLASRFARRYPGRPLLVADIAHEMTRCAAAQVPGALAFDADATALPLRNASCGLLLSTSMYQWVTDLDRAFAENHRVLRPGGLFVFALFVDGTLAELRAAHAAALDESGVSRTSHMQAFPTIEEVASALERTGFGFDLECCREVEFHPDVATLLRNLKRIGAQNVSLDRPPGLAARRVTLRMMARYAAQFGETAGIPASYRVVYGVARKGAA